MCLIKKRLCKFVSRICRKNSFIKRSQTYQTTQVYFTLKELRIPCPNCKLFHTLPLFYKEENILLVVMDYVY